MSQKARKSSERAWSGSTSRLWGAADEVGRAVAQHGERLVVDVDDRAVQREGDEPLRLADGGDLPLEVGAPAHLVRDVDGVFDDAEGAPVHVEDRVVGGLEPQVPPVPRDPPEVALAVEAAREVGPEGRIGGAVGLGAVHEHAVVPPAHLRQPVARGGEEVVVGVEDRPVEGERDHALRLVDGGDLALVVGLAKLLVRDDRGVFDDLHGPAVGVEDGVVGGLQPDLAAAAPEAPELAGLVAAPRERAPELGIVGAVGVGRLHEHAVVVADDLVARVADRLEEDVVGVEDDAAHVEGDDGMRLVDRRDLPLEIGLPQLRLGHHGGIFDDLEDAAAHVDDGAVGALQPDRRPVPADPAIVSRTVPALGEVGPEAGAVRVAGLARADEDAVVPSDDLVEGVAHGVEEPRVGVLHDAVGGEVDDGLGGVDRGDLAAVHRVLELGLGIVRADLDDVAQAPFGVEPRPERAAQPQLRAVPAQAAVVQRQGPALRHRGPQPVEPGQVVPMHQRRVVEPRQGPRDGMEERVEIGVGAQDAPLRREDRRRQGRVQRLTFRVLHRRARAPRRVAALAAGLLRRHDPFERPDERAGLDAREVVAGAARQVVEPGPALRGMARQCQGAAGKAPLRRGASRQDPDVAVAAVAPDPVEDRLGGLAGPLDHLREPALVQAEDARDIGLAVVPLARRQHGGDAGDALLVAVLQRAAASIDDPVQVTHHSPAAFQSQPRMRSTV